MQLYQAGAIIPSVFLQYYFSFHLTSNSSISYSRKVIRKDIFEGKGSKAFEAQYVFLHRQGARHLLSVLILYTWLLQQRAKKLEEE